MTRLRPISLLLLVTALTFAGTSTVLAAWNGGINARDRADGGWIGNDNPDNVRRPHGPDSVWQDLSLGEWDEPNHDWVYDRWNKWGQAAKDLFNAQWRDKGLGTQLRIEDQFYCDYTGVANWNFPYSKNPENENPIEELAQGLSGDPSEATQPGGSKSGQRTLVRMGALLVLLVVAVVVGLLVAVVGALLINRALVTIVGAEAIADVDGTFVMTGLMLADYAIAIVAGLAVTAFGWIRIIRPRT